MALSLCRIGELLDHATNNGEYDENSPEGPMCNDYRRDLIRALKELLWTRGENPENRYKETENG